MPNILKLTFTAPAQVDEELNFEYYGAYPLTNVFSVNSRFKTTRVNPGEVTIGINAADQAQKYVDAFLLDYTSNFTITILGAVVTITCTNGSDIFNFGLSPGSSVFVTANSNSPGFANFCVYPFSLENIFYSKDLDYLKFTSTTTESFVKVNLDITIYSYKDFTPLNYFREFKVPFFNKKCEFHIGSIIHQLFEQIESIDQAINSKTSNYQSEFLKPAKIIVSVQEFKFDNSVDSNLQYGTLPLFYMIKGRKNYTTTNNLSLLSIQQQEVSRVTKNSVIGFSFTHDSVPKIIVKRNNIIIDNVLLDENSDNKIYSYYRFINDFNIGDLIQLIVVHSTYEFRTHNYLVFPDGLNSLQLFFENDNGVIEPFEFTGRIFGSLGYKNVNKTEFKNLHEIESKEISNSTEVLTINPGKILKSDMIIIDKILRSKNVWIDFNGEFIKIDAITNKLPLFDSESNELSNNLEFNILENTDAKIYIQ